MGKLLFGISPRTIIFSLAAGAALYATTFYHYLLFHSLAELFSILVAFGIFVVAWHTRGLIQNNYLMLLGVSYLYIGGLDLLHTLGYDGMGVFEPYGPGLAPQLWIGARYMEAITLLLAPMALRDARPLNVGAAMLGYLAVTATLIFAIFSGAFPVCFVPGQGLTAFKVASEYVISGILACSFYMLHMNRDRFDTLVFRMLAASILTTIGAELAFTFYIKMYGFSNLVGHYLKIISFYLIYRAIIQTGLEEPYRLLFRDLKQKEENLALAQEIASLGNWRLDIHSRRFICSDQMLRIFGIGREGFGGTASELMTLVHENDRDLIKRSYRAAVEERIPYGLDHRIVTPEGIERIVHAQGEIVLGASGEPAAMVGTVQDVTTRKKIESDLQRALQDKDMLIKEVHHRVKNNLNIVQSLLSLQIRSIGDEAARAALQEGMNRLQAMSLIHEKLYKANDIKQVHFSEYAHGLVLQLFKNYRVSLPGVNLALDFEDCYLEVDTVVPLGLILNEAVTNACKYAFRGRDKGCIRVGLKVEGAGLCVLSIEDDGAGLPKGFDPKTSDTLGMMLITSLADQIGATLEIIGAGGVKYRLSFQSKRP